MLRPRTTGTGQKGWKGEGEYEVELPFDAGEGSSVTVKARFSRSSFPFLTPSTFLPSFDRC